MAARLQFSKKEKAYEHALEQLNAKLFQYGNILTDEEENRVIPIRKLYSDFIDKTPLTVEQIFMLADLLEEARDLGWKQRIRED